MPATMNRPQFFGGTARIASVAVPMMIPASALGRAGRIAPSERIVMGSIGVGTMGFGDMHAFMSVPEAQVVAACDVKSTMRERAKQAVDAHYGNTDCAVYNDFRELLARGSSIPTGFTSATTRWDTCPAGAFTTSTSPSGEAARS